MRRRDNQPREDCLESAASLSADIQAFTATLAKRARRRPFQSITPRQTYWRGRVSRSRPQFEVLAQAVAASPPIGVPVRVARDLIQAQLGIPVQAGHVYQLFVSNQKLQQEFRLTIAEGYVRLRPAAMIERLERERLEQLQRQRQRHNLSS